MHSSSGSRKSISSTISAMGFLGSDFVGLCALPVPFGLRRASASWLRQIWHSQVNRVEPAAESRKTSNGVDHRDLHHVFERRRVQRVATRGERSEARRVSIEEIIESPLFATKHPLHEVGFIQQSCTSPLITLQGGC